MLGLAHPLVDRPTQLICISDIYLLSTDKYKRHSRVICYLSTQPSSIYVYLVAYNISMYLYITIYLLYLYFFKFHLYPYLHLYL